MSDPIEPLSPFARALVDLEKLRPDPPEDVEARIRARLEETVGMPAQPADAPVIPLRPPARRWRWPWVAGTILAGLAAAAAAGAYVRETARNEELRERIRQLESAPPPSIQSPTVPPAPPPAPPLTARPPPPAQTAAPRPSKGSLAAEKVLLERARTALLRGEPAAALEALDTHLREHGQGQLAEEREVMRIHVLVQLGRREDAQGAALELRRRYPGSVMLPSVESALATSP